MSIKTVIIKRRPNATNLPEEVYSEAKRKIGSTFSVNGDTNTGLTFGEQKKYLPGVIGIDSSDVNFQKEVRKYFQDMSLTIENTGTKLEVGTDENGDPNNLLDYIRYKFALAHPYVAKDEQELYSNKKYKYFIYDTAIEKAKQAAGVKNRKEAYKAFIKLSADPAKVNQMLLVYGYNPKSMDETQKEITLEGELDSNPSEFLMYANDKNIEYQAFIEDCLSNDVLRRVGQTYLNGDENIGDSLEGAVLYLKDKKNSEVYATLKARLKTFSE